MLVGVEDLGIALALRDLHGDDLRLELARRAGGRGAHLALEGEFVLHLSCDSIAFGHVLCRDAHVDIVHRATETVDDDVVD